MAGALDLSKSQRFWLEGCPSSQPNHSILDGEKLAFYIIPYLFLVGTFWSGLLLKVKVRDLLLLCSVPAVVLVVIRGDVGTDTASYIQILDSMQNVSGNLSGYGVEFGFYIFKVFLYLGLSPRTVALFISGLVCVLALFSFSRRRDDAIVFTFLVFPVFFYDMSMNGLRYGMAFCFAKLAADYLDEKKLPLAVLFFVLAFSFHVSSLLVFVLLAIRKISRNALVAFGALALIGAAVSSDQILLKMAAYESLESPDGLSGLAPLMISILIFMASLFFSPKSYIYLTFLLVSELSSFVLAKYSYAGLRLQFLILFVMCCGVPALDVMHARRRPFFMLSLMLIGVVGFAASMRNMVNGQGEGESPFLPYHFFWEVK
ncbi:MAG: EpsG family protein [Pseudomonas sp.]|uniref:EpsG family protein n=1 Tax=Pseudomonadaceae TaxID=135621 RepID=UPI0009E2C962|nr:MULTISPECIES: EpsG family protein [Pseudomonadaceae]MAL37478.1 EpsG family protein [Pseudomonas sp.]MBK3796947.1 hypothetical protein [Stutzerimonas stutzeri]MBK3877450.1 hypothetical protein [Stutzerimonas stutzeri]HBM09171.1 EpsG family protein [Pseudomonas sp.]